MSDRYPQFIVGPADELTVQTAVARLIKAALKVWNSDVHDHQARPCPTCPVISEIVGEDWGCVVVYKARLKERKK